MFKILSKSFFIPFWPIIPFTLNLASCLSLPSPEADDKHDAELIKTQSQLIVSYLNQGLAQRALKELRVALLNAPEVPEYNNLMGLTQLSLKNPRKAIVYLKKSHELKPRISVSLNLSSAYIQAGQYANANKLLNSVKSSPVFNRYPYPERVLHNLGLVAEKQKRAKTAIRNYRLALEENPTFYQSLLRLAKLYIKLGNGAKGRRAVEAARKACKICWEPTEILTRIHIDNGRPHLATKVIKDYLAEKNLSKDNRQRAQQLMRYSSQVGRKARSTDRL